MHPRGEGAAGLKPSPPNQNFKYTHFVDMMISKVVHDYASPLNQPLKSADV
jgi:hypothetical protein